MWCVDRRPDAAHRPPRKQLSVVSRVKCGWISPVVMEGERVVWSGVPIALRRSRIRAVWDRSSEVEEVASNEPVRYTVVEVFVFRAAGTPVWWDCSLVWCIHDWTRWRVVDRVDPGELEGSYCELVDVESGASRSRAACV